MEEKLIASKIVLLGKSGVGKTSFCHRVKNNIFVNQEPTIGCEFFARKLDRVKLLIWDTAGQEIFNTFTPQFCRNAKIALIFDDLTELYSAKDIQNYVKFLEAETVVIIVPTKYDLHTNNYIYNLHPIECDNKIILSQPISSKDNININSLLNLIQDTIIEQTDINRSYMNNLVNINKDNNHTTKCCNI